MTTNAKQILFIDNDPHLVRSVPQHWMIEISVRGGDLTDEGRT
jgi:hypothetical protein